MQHGGKEKIRANVRSSAVNVRTSAVGATERVVEAAATSKQIGKGAGLLAKTIASDTAENLKGYADGQDGQELSEPNNPSGRLRTIDYLLKSGQITEEEYAKKRMEILDQI
mgnify:CR=1 FL=1